MGGAARCQRAAGRRLTTRRRRSHTDPAHRPLSRYLLRRRLRKYRRRWPPICGMSNNDRQPFGAALHALNDLSRAPPCRPVGNTVLSSMLFAELLSGCEPHRAAKIPAGQCDCSARSCVSRPGRSNRSTPIVRNSRPPARIEELRGRGIDCGAFADPWNVRRLSGAISAVAARGQCARPATRRVWSRRRTDD